MQINYHVTGTEHDRYANIHLAIISGAKVCKDEPDDE